MPKCTNCDGTGSIGDRICPKCDQGEVIVRCPVCGECFVTKGQLDDHLNWIEDHAKKQAKEKKPNLIT